MCRHTRTPASSWPRGLVPDQSARTINPFAAALSASNSLLQSHDFFDEKDSSNPRYIDLRLVPETIYIPGAQLHCSSLLHCTIFDLIEHGLTSTERKKDIKRHAYILNIEAFLLARWAENAGILKDSGERDGVGRAKMLSNPVAKQVQGALERVFSLLEKSRGIIEKHEDPSDLVPIPRLRSRSTSQIIAHRVKGFQDITRSVIWVIRDSKQFAQAVSEIAHLLALLCQLVPENPEDLKRHIFVDALPESEQADLDTLIELRIDAGEDEDGPVKSALQFINRAALIRRALPIWGVDQCLSSTGDVLSPLAIPDFETAMPQSLSRWITKVKTPSTMDLVPVMVEWRWTELIGNATGPEQHVFKHDVARLAKLLTLASAWPEYHILKCLGYFVDSDYRGDDEGPRYGVVFQLPRDDQGEGAALQNLSQAIQSPKSSNLRLTPDDRLRFAQQLASAIYYLLTIGWLHKAIHSENVFLLGRPSNTIFKSSKIAREVRLGGFEFARPDQPSQRSLEPRREAFLDLYRHPECRSSARTTPEYLAHGYKTIYDIYSLGIVLFEIGLSRTVENVSVSFNEKRRKGLLQGQQFEAYLIEKVRTDLKERMGLEYANSVEVCLAAEDRLATTGGGGDTGGLMSKFNELVLQPLLASK